MTSELIELIVVESDDGGSLNLEHAGAQSVDYDDDGNSVTTYLVERAFKRDTTQQLEQADGVVSYRWIE